MAGNTAAITRTVGDIYRGIRDAERPQDDLMDLTSGATTVRLEPAENRSAPDPPAGSAQVSPTAPVRGIS